MCIRDSYAATRNVATPFGTFPFPVATLEAPPQGQAFRVERMAIGNLPNVSTIAVYAGQLGSREAIRDQVSGSTAPVLASDDPNGIYLPPATELHIVWFDSGADPEPYNANLQLRVEEL